MIKESLIWSGLSQAGLFSYSWIFNFSETEKKIAGRNLSNTVGQSYREDFFSGPISEHDQFISNYVTVGIALKSLQKHRIFHYTWNDTNRRLIYSFSGNVSSR